MTYYREELFGEGGGGWGGHTTCTCMFTSYLNDFLGQSVVEAAELLPVGDEQLEHVAGRLSHSFVLKLDKQTGGGGREEGGGGGSRQDKGGSMTHSRFSFL